MTMPAVGGSGREGRVATTTDAWVGAGVRTGVGSGVATGSGSTVATGVACAPRTTSARATSRTRSGMIPVDSTAAVANARETDIECTWPANDGRRNGTRQAQRNTHAPALASTPLNTGGTLCTTDSTMCRFHEHAADQ